eukprot:CAMPEP_0194573464 /NCGR_PEP_ID=MMETSP0292-20121207/9671_1 /TAXON_ID=39354 /ORGANISM="Heterosigma akashiwo, Strain CCMP2393" /LENGTH=62 /DNA_ID=CAMNT_0039424723 /DNA_START=46 /DNA_END=234 /DNA_ORIENTATION=+
MTAASRSPSLRAWVMKARYFFSSSLGEFFLFAQDGTGTTSSALFGRGLLLGELFLVMLPSLA